MEEDRTDYIKKLFEKAEEHIKNLEVSLKELKEKGITFCSNCGCSIYPDKKHKC